MSSNDDVLKVLTVFYIGEVHLLLNDGHSVRKIFIFKQCAHVMYIHVYAYILCICVCGCTNIAWM